MLIIGCASIAFSRETLLDYDMSMNPDQVGFTLHNSCGTDWNATGTMLEYRGCTSNQNASYISYDGLLDTASTAQLDIRMRILDADGYAFEIIISHGSVGYYTKILPSDFGDGEFHDITIFIDFDNNIHSSYLDEAPFEFYSFPWSSGSSKLILGDGNSSGTWGEVDIESLVITGNLVEPVENSESSFGAVKAMFR